MERKQGESVVDFKIRLYQQDHKNWDEISKALNKCGNPHHIRKTSYGYLECYRDMTENKFEKSILFLNDIHLPFERSDVKDIIKKHKHEITELFLGGDLLDCYSVSKFPHDNHLTIVDELKYGYNWLKDVRKILGKDIPIYIIKGNHEARFEKEILKDEVLQNFVNKDILQMYEDGFTLFINGKQEKYEPIDGFHYINSWYVNIDNKIMYSHPLDFSSVDGKMTEKVAEHFLNKNEEFEIAIFAHTHKYCQQTVSRRQGVFVIENGCLCMPMQYANTGKLGYTPQHYCYSIVKYNNNEPINYNNIRVYHLQEENQSENINTTVIL